MRGFTASDFAALRDAGRALGSSHSALQERIRLRLDSSCEPGTLDLDGGPGSGNWGHAGRPGMRGGSMPGGGVKNRMSAEGGGYTSAAKQRKAAKKAGKQPDKYGKLREDAREKWKQLHDAEARAKAAKIVIDTVRSLGWSEPTDVLKEYEEWEPKRKALQEEYDAAMKNAGVTTRSEQALYRSDIEYNPVRKLDTPRNEEEIIEALSGGDKTEGSCVSLALAYAGQKQGLDVLDYRDGKSRDFFSVRMNHLQAVRDSGAELTCMDTAKTATTNGKRLLAQLKEGRQYYFVDGRHAAIVRVEEGKPQYLELQSPYGDNGWKNFDRDVRQTLQYRFGSNSKYAGKDAYAVDIEQIRGGDFATLLGYINTNSNEQRKGSSGSVR